MLKKTNRLLIVIILLVTVTALLYSGGKFLAWAFLRFTPWVKGSLLVSGTALIAAVVATIRGWQKLWVIFILGFQLSSAVGIWELSQLTTFHLIPYRVLGVLPQHPLTALMLLSLVMVVLLAPLALRLLVKDGNSRTAVIPLVSGLLLCGGIGFSGGVSWLAISYDEDVDFRPLLARFDSDQPRDSLAIAVLRWTHDNIRSGASMAPLPLDQLVANGRGTCGLQSKVCGALLQSLDFPVRYVTLHAPGWQNQHAVIEVYLENEWVMLDPQYLRHHREGANDFDAYELSQRPELLLSLGYPPDLWQNIILFVDGTYVKITPQNRERYY